MKKRELTEAAKEKAKLLDGVLSEKEPPADNMKALDTEEATPTVSMGAILLMRKLLDAKAISEEEVAFLHLWVWYERRTKAGRKAMARLSRKPVEEIVDAMADWMFDKDFDGLQDDLETIAESLNRVASNSRIMETAAGEGMEDDDPNPVG